MPFASQAVTAGNEEMVYFSSLSGSDMVCTIGNRVFGELQSIAYSIEREVAPIYTMGSPTLRAYSRGKRGISGSLVFQVFDRDSLLDILIQAMKDRGVDIHSAAANMVMQTKYTGAYDGGSQSRAFVTPGMHDWNRSFSIQDTLEREVTPEQIFKDLGHHNIRYADQIPPFDITITGVSELGLETSLRILKVQLITEASGTSVDDLTMEKACGFIARDVIPWGYNKIGSDRGAVPFRADDSARG